MSVDHRADALAAIRDLCTALDDIGDPIRRAEGWRVLGQMVSTFRSQIVPHRPPSHRGRSRWPMNPLADY